MPTEAEFLAAAAAFDEAAASVDLLAGPLRSRSGPEVLSGGLLSGDVAAIISTAEADGVGDASDLRALADLCRERAAVVAAAAAAEATYQRRMSSYRWQLSEWRSASRSAALDGEPFTTPAPRRPAAPPPPPAWAEF